MGSKEVPPARPGVREVADGIFLYTTRVEAKTTGGGPTFVYEVESARADLMGVSFGVDFSGSTNFVILPPAAATETSPSIEGRAAAEAARAETYTADVGTPREGQSTSCTAVVSTADVSDGAGKKGDRNKSAAVETPRIMARGEELTSAAGRNDEEGDAAEGGGGGEVLQGFSARVSAEAFCLTTVARLTVRDPKVGGTIKTSCSWDLLEPPPPPSPPAGEGNKTSATGRKDDNAAGIRQQLLSAQSLRLAGDADGGGHTRRANSRSEEIVKRCYMHGALYADLDFPPNDSSLGPSLATTGVITWRRPAEFPGIGAATANTGATVAFGGYGKPLPSDVRPCPFAVDASLACALAALAERPLLVSGALCGRLEEVVGLPTACRSGASGGGTGCGTGDDAESLRLGNGHLYRRRGDGGDSRGVRGRAPSKEERELVAAQAFAAAARSGTFCARLCVRGVWTEYVLDDYFPCLSGAGAGAGGPCLSRAHGPATWVSMLEKAYARAVGSYSAALGGCCLPSKDTTGVYGRRRVVIEGGGTGKAAASVVARPAEVLGVFTGAPVLQVKVGGRRRQVRGEVEVMAAAAAATADVQEDQDELDQTAEELWGSIVSWVQQSGLVCLSTPPADMRMPDQHGGGGGGGSWKNGLRLGHAYTVLRTAAVGRGNVNRLVRLRGPLPAREGWRGEWADDSPRWTLETLSSLQQAAAAVQCAGGRNTPDGLKSLQGQQEEREEAERQGGQAFWISIGEAISSFVEAGVCFAPCPSPGRSAAAAPAAEAGGAGQAHRNVGLGKWAQEARRRVVLRKRRYALGRGGSRNTAATAAAAAAAVALGKGDAVRGRNRGENGREKGAEDDARRWGWGWAASQVYALSVYETSRMFFSLHQQKRPGEPEEPLYRDAGVTVLRRGEGRELEAIASTGNPAKAAVSTGAVLTPGKYLVVPSCTGCLPGDRQDEVRSAARTEESRRASEATDRVPAGGGAVMNGGGEGPTADEEKKMGEGGGEDEGEDDEDGDGDGDGEERSVNWFDRSDVLTALGDMFDGLDADCDGVLSREELDAYLRVTEGLPLKDDVYAWLVRTFSSCPRPAPIESDPTGCYRRRCRPGGGGRGRRAPAGVENEGSGGAGGAHVDLDLCLTRRGFVDMYRCIWQAAGRDLQVVTRDLRFAGCIDATTPISISDGDPLPRSTEDRFSVVISVHSDTAGFDFVAQPSDPEAIEAALTLPVQRWGFCYQSPPFSELGNAPQPELVGPSMTSSGSTARTTTHNNDNNNNNNNNNNSGSSRVSGSSGVLMLHVRPGPKGAESAVTFAAKSLVAAGGGTVRARLDCAGSLNASPLPGSVGLLREVTLLPGQSKVIQHLVPTYPRQPWSWRHSPLMAVEPSSVARRSRAER